jgi:glycosyltransferase involved in cell wall biosynthesis
MKVSIVTPSFNQLDFLRQTAASVLGQHGEFDLEWIIVDGGSTDGTVDYLKSITDGRVQWMSERDAGQSDAVNKGFKLIRGDVVGWINSDDLYVPGAIDAVVKAFSASPAARWAVGRYEIVNDQGVAIRPGIVRYKEKQLRHYTYRGLLRENFIPQPAVFWRRNFGQEIGLLDKSLHYTMDYDFWLRMGWHFDPLFIDQVLAQFRVHESSKTGVINRKQFDEGYKVAAKYAGDDVAVLRAHRFSVEKIVWAYRLMRLIGK